MFVTPLPNKVFDIEGVSPINNYVRSNGATLVLLNVPVGQEAFITSLYCVFTNLVGTGSGGYIFFYSDAGITEITRIPVQAGTGAIDNFSLSPSMPIFVPSGGRISVQSANPAMYIDVTIFGYIM